MCINAHAPTTLDSWTEQRVPLSPMHVYKRMGERCSNITNACVQTKRQSNPQTGAVKGIQIDDPKDMVKNRHSHTSAVKDIRIDGHKSKNKHQQVSAVKTVEIY